ncbi:FecCD family ABC transporter permease [Paenibacillus mucilaginosus]|uniref:Iron ABC transporter permease n=3 Tax=Paenibacillus mucilaginosus TaxID=61624 RepID=H6NHX9_9BACL|nr:iron chelate uptake ABC transporter family permease subunit [Paenibacillus mucilaginosus]AEI41689.1 iron ABC transporter permease [Paenibacillus mucilaginosus KNP414]AFC30200.1 iron ABC transporter permease [Paenibacillus mucilaginosus 3016]MCG7214383.1 iron ABC transporter permease [Paenibacillus mucilaginosus]WDM30669.1 iron chelate uptake ABC transporter family permease subunit [Paenibacillus mucilaginosus]WFA18845.1 iron ABC transporter permease [Paenibacillus mucilaginosus]
MNRSSVSNHTHPGSPIPRNYTNVLVICLVLLGLCVVASLVLGSRPVRFHELIDGLFHPNADSYGADVVRKRISRTVFGLCCGAALGVSGALMQAVTRNPIADPSILGVNTGASLFVVCGIAFLNISTANQYIWLALAGALITAVFVFGIGSMGRGGATPLKLVLAGAATSAALSSLVSAIMIPRSYVMDQFRFWQVGSVGSANWSAIATFAPFLIVGILIAIITAPALNALALGDDAATGLGVRTGILRLAAALAGVLLCGAATALAGPIGFVGLLSTHVVRLMLGPDLRFVIPLSAVSGAIILMVSDVTGRLIGSPGELEVGVVTAFIGAPILILLAMRAKVRSL